MTAVAVVAGVTLLLTIVSPQVRAVAARAIEDHAEGLDVPVGAGPSDDRRPHDVGARR